eukprot:1390716-Amorphochlora_amoeboformis.AAC.2
MDTSHYVTFADNQPRPVARSRRSLYLSLGLNVVLAAFVATAGLMSRTGSELASAAATQPARVFTRAFSRPILPPTHQSSVRKKSYLSGANHPPSGHMQYQAAEHKLKHGSKASFSSMPTRVSPRSGMHKVNAGRDVPLDKYRNIGIMAHIDAGI